MGRGGSGTAPRSMTCALAGTARVPPACTIRFPCTRTAPGLMRVSDRPSNRRAARRTIGFGVDGVCAVTVDAKRRRATAIFFMAAKSSTALLKPFGDEYEIVRTFDETP